MTEQAQLPQAREELETEVLCAFLFKNTLNQELTDWLDHMEEVLTLEFLTLVSPKPRKSLNFKPRSYMHFLGTFWSFLLH